MEISIQIGNDNFIVAFNANVTCPGYPAKLSGPPEDCYPGEAMEFEATLVSLTRDLPLVTPAREKWADPALYDRKHAKRMEDIEPLDIPDWLCTTIETWLIESDAARELVQEENDSWMPRPRLRSRRFG